VNISCSGELHTIMHSMGTGAVLLAKRIPGNKIIGAVCKLVIPSGESGSFFQ